MKKFILVVLLLVSFSASADEWRTEDTYREVTYLTVHVIDWAQTHTISANPDKFYELNPRLGAHPSSAQVNTYFAITALAHYGIAKILPYGWRENFQYVSITIESGQVVKNYMIDIHISL